MNAIQKYAAETKARFTKLDAAIAEFEARKQELTAQIDNNGGDYSLKAVQGTGALRMELSQISEALERAQGQRRTMAGDMAVNINATLSRVLYEHIGDIGKENAGRIREIWDFKSRTPTNILPPYLSHDGANAEIIRCIERKCRSYNREFEQQGEGGGK